MKKMVRYTTANGEITEEYSPSVAVYLMDMGIKFETFEEEEVGFVYLADWNEDSATRFRANDPEVERLLTKENPCHVITEEDAEAIWDYNLRIENSDIH